MSKNSKENLTKYSPFLILLAIYISSYIIAIPLAVKIMAIGPFIVPGGIIAASFTYLCTDIVDEVYGAKIANFMITCGLIAIIFVLLLIQIDLYLPKASFWQFDKSYQDIFGMSIRLSIAGILAFILGQYLDVFLFSKIKKLTNGKFLWFRNNLSTAISKLIDCSSFSLIAFYGIYEFSELINMIMGTYIFYLLIALLDTPLVYLGVYLIYKKYPELKT